MIPGLIRYQAAAIALKLFSSNASTRAIYRRLGNSLRGRQITDLRGSYAERAAWLLDSLRQEGLLDGRPLAALEIGTGWMHFYGIILALAGLGPIDLYDQWDNRQFLRLKRSFDRFECNLDTLGLSDAERSKACKTLTVIRRSSTFRDLYSALKMRYIIDARDDFASLKSESYDVVCSLDVLEHVRFDSLAAFVRSMHRVLKPGGISLHQIGLDDHLAHYDRAALKKQHVHYADREWNLRFANRIQYFSRVTYDELKELFRRSGFDEIACTSEQDPAAVDRRKLAARFRGQTEESLLAVRGLFLHRKASAR